MKQDHKDIMIDIFGTADITTDSAKYKIISNFHDYESRFYELEEIYKEPGCEELRNNIVECHVQVLKLYDQIIMNTIYEFAEIKYGQSFDFILINYQQSEIETKMEAFLNAKGLPNTFKVDVYNYIKVLADRLDKRFAFDEIALVNLIEASCGKNIYTEQGGSLRTDLGDDKYIIRNGDKYEYKRTHNIETSDDGRTYYKKDNRTVDNSKLLDPTGTDRLSEDKILLQSFPLGNKILPNTDRIMNKLIGNLFENLELCIETYNTIYSSGNNIVDNTALLADGSTFDFSFIVDEINIPHLLGIPRPNRGEVSQKSIDILNSIKHNGYPPLSVNSNSLDLLKFIRAHENEIIELGGLYEENGKKYEILNWEKIVLKTASFMRGDFFKTCFCLAKLAPNKYLNDPKEKGGYVSITSTEYKKGINSSISARSVLNDLLNTTRQRKDFIFRGFINDNGRNIVNSIMTGKSETIRAGKNNDLIKTLQKYRNLFYNGSVSSAPAGWGMTTNGEPIGTGGIAFDDSIRDRDELIGSIVEEVVNEKYIKKFTPEEQAQLGISISRDLFFTPTMTKDAIDVLQQIHEYNNAVTTEEIDDMSKSNGFGHKK